MACSEHRALSEQLTEPADSAYSLGRFGKNELISALAVGAEELSGYRLFIHYRRILPPYLTYFTRRKIQSARVSTN